MIPISDDNPTHRPAVVTYAILAVLLLVWVLYQGGLNFDESGMLQLAASVCNMGLVPAELTGAAPVGTTVPIAQGLGCVVDNDPVNYFTPISSMFLHGSWSHLLGNGLFLWVFGNNVEDVMGRLRFLAFYLLCGLVASAAHVLVTPDSPIPTVGASGAISGVMGAYLVLFPRVRVNMLFWFIIIIRVIPVPAWLVLIYWFVLQVITGLPELTRVNSEVTGGVATWAHVGGFVAGVVLVYLFANVQAARSRSIALHPKRVAA
ncbi:MAG TPA: rhomboid family intramembrane serine protease [Gemmatimonadales bacterium]|nr:rhomboid family intramembrane serine protease [Gemmatimonadales bacterium]